MPTSACRCHTQESCGCAACDPSGRQALLSHGGLRSSPATGLPGGSCRWPLSQAHLSPGPVGMPAAREPGPAAGLPDHRGVCSSHLPSLPSSGVGFTAPQGPWSPPLPPVLPRRRVLQRPREAADVGVQAVLLFKDVKCIVHRCLQSTHTAQSPSPALRRTVPLDTVAFPSTSPWLPGLRANATQLTLLSAAQPATPRRRRVRRKRVCFCRLHTSL